MISAGSSDAVVIGAGHNGLVAANLLADAGWSVTVLEATASAGGAVRSGQLTTPGYLSDHCSAFFPLAAISPVLHRLALGRYGLRWVHAPDVLGHLLPDGRAAVLSRDLARTAESVAGFAGADRRRWPAAYREWLHVSKPLTEALMRPFPPVRAGAALIRRSGVAGGIRLMRRLLVPARQLSAELFDGDGAALLLAGCAMHTDLSLDAAGSGVYGWLLSMVGQEHGFPVPQGGAQKITDALVARLTARGGQIVHRASAAQVVVRHGRAIGVVDEDGRCWAARSAVLADVPAPVLYLDLVGAKRLPPRLVDDLRHFRWDGSTVKIDWALSGPVPWINPDVSGAGTVHLGADLNGLTAYAADLACGRLPQDPFLLAGQMTLADPTRSPQGTESLWAYTHLPHRPYWEADRIDAHAERMEQVLARHAPGFSSLVLARHVAGPAQLQHDNPGLVGGAIGGGTAAAHQQLFLRPVPGLGRADTPIEGLFMAGTSSHPGGGVHGAPGANAARAAIASARPVTGVLYRAALSRAQRAIYRPAPALSDR